MTKLASHLAYQYGVKLDEKPTRDGYGEALVELGHSNPDVVVMDADLAKSTRTEWFWKQFPDRFFDAGIAEQNMLCMCAGLACAGKIPFASTYGVFVAGRAWDQIRTTVCYTNLNVKIGGAHGGISVGPDGATHQALEEIALMRVLPNMTVLSPADYLQTRRCVHLAAEMRGPVYIRFGREPIPIITTDASPFELGKGDVYRDGSDASIIATGPMVKFALDAAEELAREGLDVRVVNIHTIKPIDAEIIEQAARETGAIVTAEEHQVMAGFGSAVAEVVVQRCPVPMRFIGIQDRFGESGQPEELMDLFGLMPRDIKAAVRQAIAQKG
ncbi:MAG: transketolase family protein [Acidobacteriota bacterium]|nr:transketolase family protein [Acidobacteriota bacterium]